MTGAAVWGYALTLDDEQPPRVGHVWNAGDRFVPA
jgi:hypothetical protein